MLKREAWSLMLFDIIQAGRLEVRSQRVSRLCSIHESPNSIGPNANISIEAPTQHQHS